LQKKKDKSMPSRNLKSFESMALPLCALCLTVCGCARNAAKAAPPVAAVPAPVDSKPITNVAPDTNALPPVDAVTPPVSNTPPVATEIPVTPTRTKPAPPRKPAPEPAADTSASEQPTKPPAPQIVPQISAGDQQSYQRKTEDDISVAQSNLDQANGKQLSAAQSDLVQKIQSFLAQSRDASKSGDWARAQVLSQKARLLSVELVESL
jgi:hypothetical protein